MGAFQKGNGGTHFSYSHLANKSKVSGCLKGGREGRRVREKGREEGRREEGKEGRKEDEKGKENRRKRIFPLLAPH